MRLKSIFTKQNKKTTVAEAIQDCKILEKRIDKAIQKARFYKLSNSKMELAKKPSEQLQSIEDLISHLGTLKSAIIQCNANTSITLGDETIKVSEAIILRDVLQKHILNLQSKLENDFSAMERAMINSVEDAKDKAGDRNGDDLEKFIELMSIKNTTEEDLSLRDVIDRLEAFEEMLQGVNNKLNISNATTELTY